LLLTSSSAIAEGQRDALSQLKSILSVAAQLYENHIWLEGLPFQSSILLPYKINYLIWFHVV